MVSSLLLVAAVSLLLFLAGRSPASRRASRREVKRAKAIAAVRLYLFQEEREARFRLYHEKWTMALRRQAFRDGRPYVLPFVAGASR